MRYISSAVYTYAFRTAIHFPLGVRTRPDPGYHWRMLLRSGRCLIGPASVQRDVDSGCHLSRVCICVSCRIIMHPWLVQEQHHRAQPRRRESCAISDARYIPISIGPRGPHASRISWTRFSLTGMCHVRICIKEYVENGMTEALVEQMIDRMCTFELRLPQMLSILQTEIDNAVILNDVRDDTTAGVYDSEEQIDLMRRIFEYVQEEQWDEDGVVALDAAVEDVGRGPLFFNLIVIIYKHCSKKWKTENGLDSDDQNDDDDMSEPSEDDDDDGMVEAGVPHQHVLPMSAGVDMGAMLNQLQELV